MSQNTVILGRIGKHPEIKQGKNGYFIKVPVCVNDFINGRSVDQWYQCNIFSPNRNSLENVIKEGLIGIGAIVTLSGKHYLINTDIFVGLGFSCNQIDMKVVLGAKYINESKALRNTAGQQQRYQTQQSDYREYQQQNPLRDGENMFEYKDDLPY
ncbi:hypothetical protein [Vibrio parahaemolyticus]|uniref:hypothetical protein n=1 Tax=Vibrio parahaemolyticus TaxID=670 RepID=UPI0005C6E930